MDPGGNSALLSVFGLGIERYNFVTHTLMQVSNDSGALGMAYDSAGHLFVVTAPNQIAQMDPGGAGANGLAFDSFTGKLYVTDDLNGSDGERSVSIDDEPFQCNAAGRHARCARQRSYVGL
jgi:hypothetical protein